MNQNFISFSLYGTDPKYCDGMVENLMCCMCHYGNSWTPVVYTEKNHPLIAKMTALGAWVHVVDNPKLQDKQMFWRFLAINIPYSNAIIFRDADSRIGPREVEAVKEWMASPFHFHIMRDHPHHAAIPILGGMWGCKGIKIPDLEKDIENFPQTGYNADQVFLYHCIFPNIFGSLMIHGYGGKPFPEHEFDPSEYVGQVWNARYERDESRPKVLDKATD